ncbi:HEPN domain-containing protein [Cryomorpha ignava]|uniref:HEPN domain-containing protein n=1 Tax=Cryomorpha ignava TaxID=101383 RepID=A0A7K3WRQ2_9FLAO|nr:HEPN domain-containing protein [Cryomorpha ignava]NEN24359.1 HEPN domain-containing protein [Cryomorpha ignava]
MIDVKKQIAYWINGAEDDLVTAALLIREKRILHGLFFCHLVIEKAIKAHVVKTSEEVAPKSHNLVYLSEKAGLELNEENQIFLGILMKYQLQGRYPDYNPMLPDISTVNNYYEMTKILIPMAKSEIVEILKKYISLLRSEGITVDKAFLYGSYLSNTATEDSDIDVLIVSENEDDQLTGRIWNLTRKVNTKIEPYLVGKDIFNSTNISPLIDLVKRTGLEIR